MSSSTPPARRARRLRVALGGLAVTGGALLATAAPALAAPADTTDSTSEQADASGATPTSDPGYGSTRAESSASPEALDWKNQEGGGGPSSDPAAIDGQAPTPADHGAPYGEEKGGPEVGGVPLKGTLDSLTRATSILPGAGPGDYA